MSDPLDIEQIKQRLAAATPGPWDYWSVVADGRVEVYVPNGSMDTEVILEFKDFEDCPDCIRPASADSDLIAHAPTDIAALINEVEKLRATIERLHNERDVACASIQAERVAEKRRADDALAEVEKLRAENKHIRGVHNVVLDEARRQIGRQIARRHDAEEKIKAAWDEGVNEGLGVDCMGDTRLNPYRSGGEQ